MKNNIKYLREEFDIEFEKLSSDLEIPEDRLKRLEAGEEILNNRETEDLKNYFQIEEKDLYSDIDDLKEVIYKLRGFDKIMLIMYSRSRNLLFIGLFISLAIYYMWGLNNNIIVGTIIQLISFYLFEITYRQTKKDAEDRKMRRKFLNLSIWSILPVPILLVIKSFFTDFKISLTVSVLLYITVAIILTKKVKNAKDL